jgi:hypothetical protein
MPGAESAQTFSLEDSLEPSWERRFAMNKHVELTIVLSLAGLLPACASNKPLTLNEGVRWPSQVAALCVDSVKAAEGVEIEPVTLNDFHALVRTNVDGSLAPATTDRTACARDLTLSCLVTKYKPGSRFARAMLAGLGSAHFDVEYSILDSERNPLASGMVTKSWSWGGIMGMSKGIEDLVREAAGEIAEDLVRFRKELLEKPGATGG